MESKYITEKNTLFENLLSELEDEYYEYFNYRKSSVDDRRDKIKDHYMLGNFNNTLVQLSWLEDSDLRNDIKTRAELIFRQVFV